MFLRYIYTLGETDIYVAPCYAILFLLLTILIWQFTLKNKVNFGLFIFSFLFKLVSAVVFCLVYQFYYTHGDSFRYYRNGTRLYNLFYNEDFSYFLNYLFANELSQNFKLQDFLYKYELIIGSSESFFFTKISGLIGIFAMNSYVAITFVLSFFCFTGLVAFLYILYDKYKTITLPMFIAVMFIPSVCFWSSSLLKDTVLVGSIGWMFFCVYKIFKGKFWFGLTFVIFIFNVYLCQNLKPFVNYIFFPSVAFYAVIWYHCKFKGGAQKFYKSMFALASVFLLALIHLAVGLQIIYNKVFTVFLSTAINYQTYHGYLAEQGQVDSGYNLGAMDYSFTGVVSKIPASLVVSLFRPYLWECHNVVMLVSAVESIFVLFFTIYVFIKVGFLYPFKKMLNDPFYAFLVVFSFGFLFVTGFITFNFGTLVRYKIPGMITYLLALSILLQSSKSEQKPIFVLEE